MFAQHTPCSQALTPQFQYEKFASEKSWECENLGTRLIDTQAACTLGLALKPNCTLPKYIC